MRRPKPDRFVTWKKIDTTGTCGLISNSVLPHSKDQAIAAVYQTPQTRVGVCENCDAYIRAAKWLAERGKPLTETIVFAAAQVVKTGTYVYEPPPGTSHMKRNVFHHLSKLHKEGLLTKESSSDSAKDRTVVTFRLVP